MSAETKVVQVRPLGSDELTLLAILAARCFVENPLPMSIFAGDARRRERRLFHVYRALLATMPHPAATIWTGKRPLGLLGVASPGRGHVTPSALPGALIDALWGARPSEVAPALRWVRAVGPGARSAGEWQIGPLVVEPGHRGGGIGSTLMESFCSRIDEQNAPARVATDDERNVSFYERFGFALTDCREVIGVRVWLMRRPAGAPCAKPHVVWSAS